MDMIYGNIQKDLLGQWESGSLAAVPSPAGNTASAQQNYEELHQVFTGEDQQSTAEAPGSDGSNPGKQEQTGNSPGGEVGLASYMLGVIEINKIGLKLPILQGATQENLKYGTGHLSGTALPGSEGNSAIAAHRSRSFGKMFNRLNEISVDDEIIVKDRNRTYIYKVYRTDIVTPDNLSVLESRKDEKILTLITCDPVDTATHRLIIQAKLQGE
jgi:sortase A